MGKVYANILCDVNGKPYKMIVVATGENVHDAGQETVIPISNTSLKTAKKAAYDVYGVTDLFISKVIETPSTSKGRKQ